MNRFIIRYHVEVAIKSLFGAGLSLIPSPRLDPEPRVTIFISSLNTRYPLELTIRSLLANTDYRNFELWFGENASTDGSAEFLESLNLPVPVKIIHSPATRLHHEWLDDVAERVETPYWCSVDSDVLFLGRDWLADMVAVMEANPNVYIVGSDREEARVNDRSLTGETIDLGRRIPLWLFLIRTSFREHVKTSFAPYRDGINPETGNPLCYDTGGKLLMDLLTAGLDYVRMPWWYRFKFHHFGNLSWFSRHKMPEAWRHFKEHQLRDIRRRAEQYPHFDPMPESTDKSLEL